MDDIKVLSSKPDSLSEYLAKLLKYKSLIITLAKRDLQIKYAQTTLGIFWIIIQPIPSVIIFTFIFGKLLNIDTGKLPYPIFALTGLIGWTFFSNLSNGISLSLIESQQLLKKIYFPKLILSLSKIIVCSVDFLISFIVVIIAMLFFKVIPSWTIIFFPIFFLINIIIGFSIGIWLSVLTFRYRDLLHIAPVFINFTIWLTPVFYTVTILPVSLNYLMYLNPIAFVIEGYRFVLTGEQQPSLGYLYSIIPTIFLFITGILYFRKVEEDIVEMV